MKRFLVYLAIFFLVGCIKSVKNGKTLAVKEDSSVIEGVEGEIDGWFGGKYEVTEDFKKIRPRRIAVLPFVNETGKEEALDIVRKSFYNHFSSRNYADMELYMIDKVLRENGLFKAEDVNRTDAQKLGEILGVDAVIYGKITHFDRLYAVLYSNVSVGLEVKMVETGEGLLLWKASDVSREHEGVTSITPWGIAIDVANTAWNLREIQLLRVSDNLFRGIMKTLPELSIKDIVHVPRIKSFAHNSANAVRKKRESIEVILDGEPGLTAFFDLGEFKKRIQMKEDSKGIYMGSYQVLPGDNVEGAIIIGYLVDDSGNRSTRRDVLGTVSIDTTPPVSPLGLTSKGFDKEIVLKWKQNQEKDLARYTIYRSLTPLTGFKKIEETELTTYRDKEVMNMTRYYYKISAGDRVDNESEKSEAAEGVPVAPGPTEVEGSIREDTVWYSGASPYRIVKEVVVEKGATLKIEAGTVVESTGAPLRIRGKLLAKGEPESLIVFTSQGDSPSPGNWKGIIIDNTCKSILEHSKIQHAEVGITVDSSSPLIKACDISKNGVGLLISGSNSQALIAQNTIMANLSDGIQLSDFSPAFIGQNIISDNLTGISCDRSRPKIMKNTIANNTRSGLRLIASPSAEIFQNRYYKNGMEDILIDERKKQEDESALKKFFNGAIAFLGGKDEKEENINLRDAASKGDIAAVHKGIGETFDEDWTALMVASANGHADIVKELLNKGADINAQGKYGNNALIIAADGGYADIVQFLLKKGTDVDAKTQKGFTALMVAAANGHTDIVKILLDSGAEINVQEKYGNTALILAAAAAHKSTVRLLLDRGADVNPEREKDKSEQPAEKGKVDNEIIKKAKKVKTQKAPQDKKTDKFSEKWKEMNEKFTDGLKDLKF